jgi:hypothetical protein
MAAKVEAGQVKSMAWVGQEDKMGAHLGHAVMKTDVWMKAKQKQKQIGFKIGENKR